MLNPGVYCGGITISNNARVTFNPGIYILLGGGFDASNNATLTGQNVSFYNTFDGTHPYAPVTLTNNVTATLSATSQRLLAGDSVLSGSQRAHGLYRKLRQQRESELSSACCTSPEAGWCSPTTAPSATGIWRLSPTRCRSATTQRSPSASDLSEAGAPQKLGIALVK